MERTKKVEEEVQVEQPVVEQPVGEVKIWWKKISGGSYRLNNRMIKPNEKFMAFPSEIGKDIRDIVIPLEEIPDDAVKPAAIVKSSYQMQPRGKSKSLFDVLDLNGKVLNEKPLTKEVAQKLIKDLES